MSDPAVEAAQRAGYPVQLPGTHHIATTAVREALKPIREEFEKFARVFADHDSLYASGVRLVLDAFAPLIYTTEELGEPDPAHSPIRKTFHL